MVFLIFHFFEEYWQTNRLFALQKPFMQRPNNCTYVLHIRVVLMIGLYLAFIFTEEKCPTTVYSSGSTIPNLILNKHFRATPTALLVEWQSKSSPPHLSIYGKPVGFPWKSIHNSIEDYFHSKKHFPYEEDI